MELVKRYVYAVTNSLPESQRSEVVKELQASIEDMAQDKANGKTPTEKHFRAVLEELGNPLVVAQGYRGNKEYLIGPDFYYYYLQTLKRIIAVSAPIYTLVFALTYSYTFPIHVGNLIVAYGFGLVTVALHVLFWVTGIFVLIEKAGVKIKQFNETDGEWSLDSLPSLPEEPQISRTDTISSMAFYAGTTFGSVILWRSLEQGNNSIASLFNPELTTFWLPLLLGLSIFAFIVEGVKLIKPRLTTWLLCVTLVMNVALLAYVVGLVSTQSILSPEVSGQTQSIAVWSIGITAVIFVCSYVYESYKVVRKYLATRTTK